MTELAPDKSLCCEQQSFPSLSSGITYTHTHPLPPHHHTHKCHTHCTHAYINTYIHILYTHTCGTHTGMHACDVHTQIHAHTCPTHTRAHSLFLARHRILCGNNRLPRPPLFPAHSGKMTSLDDEVLTVSTSSVCSAAGAGAPRGQRLVMMPGRRGDSRGRRGRRRRRRRRGMVPPVLLRHKRSPFVACCFCRLALFCRSSLDT